MSYELKIDEPRWVLAYVRGNRHALPRFTKRGMPIAESVANVTQEYKSHHGGPVARDILGGIWDKLSLRQAKEAMTPKELRSAYFDAREDSKARVFIARKIARLSNAEALAAETLEATLRPSISLIHISDRSPRIERKIVDTLSRWRRNARTMEDFQRIFYYADRDSELSAWAQDKWDRLSKAEVDAARSLTALKRAHGRTEWVHAYGVMASYGWRRKDAELYAKAKWDAVALRKAQTAVTIRQCEAALELSRHESHAEYTAIRKLLKFHTEFEGLKKFYYFLCNHYRDPKLKMADMFISRFTALCKRPEDAAWLYQNFRLSASTGRRLINKFPTLVAQY